MHTFLQCCMHQQQCKCAIFWSMRTRIQFSRCCLAVITWAQRTSRLKDWSTVFWESSSSSSTGASTVVLLFLDHADGTYGLDCESFISSTRALLVDARRAEVAARCAAATSTTLAGAFERPRLAGPFATAQPPPDEDFAPPFRSLPWPVGSRGAERLGLREDRLALREFLDEPGWEFWLPDRSRRPSAFWFSWGVAGVAGTTGAPRPLCSTGLPLSERPRERFLCMCAIGPGRNSNNPLSRWYVNPLDMIVLMFFLWS